MKGKEEILKRIGSNIRFYRNSKDISQEELAYKSNLHRTYIGSIERGERNITVFNLIMISDSLEVDVSLLLNMNEGEN